MPKAAPAFGRQDAALLCGLLAFAGLVRGVGWLRTTVLFNDGPVFLAMAEAWQAGRFAEVLTHPYHPLYSILVAWASPLFGGVEAAGVGISVAGGVLAVAAVFAFAWQAFGRDVAWASAWIVSLHPWAVDFSADVMSDGIYAGFFLSGFAALCATLARPSWRAAMLCGVFAGLAYAVRPEGIGLLLLALLLFGWRVGHVSSGRGAALGMAGVILAVGMVVAVPFWSAQQKVEEGYALTSKKSVGQLIAGGPSEVERLQDRAARRRARAKAMEEGRTMLPLPESAIRSDGRPERLPPHTPGGAAEAVLRVVRTSAAAFRYELLVFAGLGLIFLRSNMRSDREGAIASSVLLYSSVLVLLVWGAGYVGRRHALTAALPAIPLAAVGWLGLCQRLQDRFGGERGQRYTARRGTVLLVVLLLFVWGPRDLRARRADRAPTRAAAEWLAEQHLNSGPVAAQKLRTAYYAEAVFVPLPPGHDGRLREQLTGRRTRWVVIDEGKLADHLGLEAGIGTWLIPRHREEGEGRQVLVLEVTPAPAAAH